MLKIGDYVRTKYGIAKVTLTEANDEDGNNVLQVDRMLEPYYWDGCDKFLCDPKDVIKSSTNIIDLIEVGDYVNGKKVIDTFTDYIFNYSEEFKVIRFSEIDILHDVKHIKSIVTHEQFESIQYKVGEKQC